MKFAKFTENNTSKVDRYMTAFYHYYFTSFREVQFVYNILNHLYLVI